MTAWRPILNAHETTVGTWQMIGPLDKVYATIAIVRRGGELGYRVTDVDAGHVGYFRTLAAAAKAAHSQFTASRGPNGMPFVGWVGAEQTQRRPPPSR